MIEEPEIVKIFWVGVLRSGKCRTFKVLLDPVRNVETLIADFGARLGEWRLWILGFGGSFFSYTMSTGDHSLAEMPEIQLGTRLILCLCLSEGFDTFPTLLCADGCSDRRLGEAPRIGVEGFGSRS